jgi:hypothetical protein
MNMAGNGPPPKGDDQRRRRNAQVAMVRLPAEGRGNKRAPNWPLIPDVVITARREVTAQKVEALEYDRMELEAEGKSVAAVERRLDAAREQLYVLDAQLKAQRGLEATLWRDLWRLPQAVQWERLKWTRDVAQYVRHKVLGELGDMDAAKEARQWSDRLGLTPMSMLRLRWEVVADELGDRRRDRPQASAQRARGRLKVVDPGAVAG